MGMNDCEMVNHCLLLVRNLFHVQPVSSVLMEGKMSSDDALLKEESNSGSSFYVKSSSTSESDPNHSTVQSNFTTQVRGSCTCVYKEQENKA